PPPKPGQQPPLVKANPSPEAERRAWTGQVAETPVPKGAANWVPRLRPIFRVERVPQELVWLAGGGSSFDPQAQSPVGAVGLFQLMPATAQSLGLKLKPRDERLVPEKNAQAAAGYLRTLYRQFRDWRLTLASYNAGPGRVGDVLKSRKARSY